MFLLWYFGEFKGLDNDVKLQVISPFIPNGDVNDDSSLDSTLTPPGIKIHVSIVMKVAASYWKHSTKEYRAAWSERANQLNVLTLPGSFRTLPKEIFVDGIDSNVRTSLELDWAFVVKKMRAMITKVPPKHLYNLKYNFGKEKVHLQKQSFGSFQINYFISLCIFGKDFCKLKMDELVYQSKKWTIIHVSSIARAKELLTIDGLSAVSFEEHNLKYSASAKVHVDFKGQEMAGYVLASSEEGLKVQLTDNHIVRVSTPQWNRGNSTYDFDKAANGARVK